MKKKVLALLMAAALTLGICVPAFGANGTNSNDGSITIENPVVGQTYSVYQILQLESYNTETPAYVYKAVPAWADFVSSSDVEGVYLSTDKDGYVTWVSAVVSEETSKEDAEALEQARVAEFAKLARAYAVEERLTANESIEAVAGKGVKFEKLNLGYYLVDTTLGTICSLDTTDPDVIMKEKNAAPENVKQVQEDSKVDDSDKGWGTWNDADINQTVSFQSTITAQAGAANYVFHDKMSEGLTFESVTGVALNETAVDSKYYKVETEGLTDGCTFEVVFTQDFCNTLNANDKIVISYTATLNEDAVVGLPGNPNESKLSYGESSSASGEPGEPSGETPPSETITYTWDVDVLKYANGDESKVLAGVEFVLLNSDKSKVAVVSNGKLVEWDDVPAAEGGSIPWPNGATLTTNGSGKIEIDGLDADTYYLREIKALDGYNILSSDFKIEIKGATKVEGSDTPTYSTFVAKVENKSGIELPSTGGIGTTLFYVVGGALVIGAAVLLVVRRRAAGSEE